MNNWKTVLAFTYPHEAHLARINLESEGIDVMIKDELTTQVNNFYSNAIGGVKLQVQEGELERAYRILKMAGYVKEPEPKQSKLLSGLDNFTSKIPLIKKLEATVRILILTAFVLVAVITPLALPSYPTAKELLVKNGWCVDQFFYEGVEYQYSSEGLQIVINNCASRMRFNELGWVNIPGNGFGNWKMKDGYLEIYNASESMYNGVYQLSFEGDYIILKSGKTTITASNIWR